MLKFILFFAIPFGIPLGLAISWLDSYLDRKYVDMPLTKKNGIVTLVTLLACVVGFVIFFILVRIYK